MGLNGVQEVAGSNPTYTDGLDFCLTPSVQLGRVACLEESMRRIALFVAVLAGCGVTEPETEITIQVQGSVTAAAEGTAISGAMVEAWKRSLTSPSLLDTALSDIQGRYSLSFVETGYCHASLFVIRATCGGFHTLTFAEVVHDTIYIRCTHEVQTIDFELELIWKGANLQGVWGTSSNDVYAVGVDGAIGRYDGTGWSAMTGGTSEDLGVVCGRSFESLYAVWGTSSNDIYAVGDFGTILHYDGTEWHEMTSGTGTYFRAVWGTSSSDIYAVGYYDILHYDGSVWGTMRTGTSSPLMGVWGTSSSDVYAVGYNGTILHYDGSVWGAMTSGTSSHLWGVWGTSSSDVYAVGSGGLILHYDGTSWSEMTSGTSSLSGVWGTSSSDIFAVGYEAMILRYDGTSWSEMASGTSSDLSGVWGTSSSDIFAVGYDGTIVHYDGTGWSEMTG